MFVVCKVLKNDNAHPTLEKGDRKEAQKDGVTGGGGVLKVYILLKTKLCQYVSALNSIFFKEIIFLSLDKSFLLPHGEIYFMNTKPVFLYLINKTIKIIFVSLLIRIDVY